MASGSFNAMLDLGDLLKRDLAALTGDEVRKLHAQTARDVRDQVIADAGAARPQVTTIVDGRSGVSEDAVKPFGVIAYRFAYWADVVTYALTELRKMSPVDSGEYRNSWIVLAGGEQVDAEHLPADVGSLAITNIQPYHRKVEVGAMKMRVSPHIVERMVGVVRRGQYGNMVQPSIEFISIANPYILRRNHGRKGRQAGDPITYPALILRPL